MVTAKRILALKDLFMLLQVLSMASLIKKMSEDHPLVPLTLYNKYKGLMTIYLIIVIPLLTILDLLYSFAKLN